MLGWSDGAALGVSLGDAEGFKEGDSVGVIEGLVVKLGFVDGCWLCFFVGSLLGFSIGKDVGIVDGESDGIVEGISPVGVADGTDDGSLVGLDAITTEFVCPIFKDPGTVFESSNTFTVACSNSAAILFMVLERSPLSMDTFSSFMDDVAISSVLDNSSSQSDEHVTVVIAFPPTSALLKASLRLPPIKRIFPIVSTFNSLPSGINCWAPSSITRAASSIVS